MARDLVRRAKRKQRASVLVLCEGSCTEPNYIGALVREFGLTAVSVPRNHQTDPLGLVRAAKDQLKANRDLSIVFVVIDCDNHPSFEQAVRLAEQSPEYGSKLILIRSFPCFEIWLIYHFEYTRAPLTSEQALARSKELYPNYDKNSVQAIEALIDDLGRAIANSKNAQSDALVTGESNCSSEMHLLVAEFIRMST